MSNKIWIIDTSVLCELLPIPGKSSEENRTQVLSDFRSRIKNKDQFLMPYTVLIEIGNHIGHSDTNRYQLAEKFITEIVQKTLDGEAPWKLMKVPDIEKVSEWLNDFPENAAKEKGYGDHSIIKEWEEYSHAHKGFSVGIWSLDNDLAGYQS